MSASRTSYPRTIAVLIFLLFCSSLGNSYSVLTHEEIVDLLWKQKIQPLLLKRFPDATEEDLRKAHAYAYGGCVLQDMGYYPFGNKYFSDLVHYVRSGDFVAALIRDSSDLNEYAFALGALAHYASDVSGHPIINRITAIEFPRLAKKYGKEVTYANDPKAHIRTEFGFDMVQVAKNRYTSDSYHDFIGFEVSRPLLERAFFETYYLKLEDVFGDVDLAIGSYRRGVGKFIPEVTRVALLSRHDQLVKENPNFSKKKFLYYLNRAGYEREWGTVYRKPGFGTRVLAFFLKIIPKVGPFRAVSFKIPTPQTEDMYIKSVDDTVENYSRLLQEVADNTLRFPNRDFDTGRETRAGEYVLTDKTYARLVHHLARTSPDPMSAALRQNVLEFYANLNDPIDTKKNKKDWEKLQQELNDLKNQCPTCQQQGHPSADQ
jgi:zinc dependent phospholipase C